MTTTTTAERVRAHHTAFAPQIEASFRECEPTYTLERQVAQARREMGEAKWQRLMAEWTAPLDALRGGGNV